MFDPLLAFGLALILIGAFRLPTHQLAARTLAVLVVCLVLVYVVARSA